MAKSILIGIQARSGSTRLPRKAFETIGGKWMLDHVIDACKKSAAFLGKDGGVTTRVVVLTPKGDPIAQAFRSRCDIIEGPEHDVLARYLLALEEHEPDLMVRITGDCPLIPSFVISRIISLALKHGYDYIGNGDERFRTSLDGVDCEVISSKLLEEVGRLAVSKEDREHVTTLIRRHTPTWARVGHVMNHFDHSSQKLSVDTPEDLDRVRNVYDSAEDKYRMAIRTLGQAQVHLL